MYTESSPAMSAKRLSAVRWAQIKLLLYMRDNMKRQTKEFLFIDISEKELTKYLGQAGYKVPIENNERQYLSVVIKKYLSEIRTYIKVTIIYLSQLRKPRVISIAARIHDKKEYPFLINRLLSGELISIGNVPYKHSKSEEVKSILSKIITGKISKETKITQRSEGVIFTININLHQCNITLLPYIYQR